MPEIQFFVYWTNEWWDISDKSLCIKVFKSCFLLRLQLDTTACTWCSSTVSDLWRPEERRAGWAAWSTIPPNSAACKHSTNCWHTDRGSLRRSTSRLASTPTLFLYIPLLLFHLLILCHHIILILFNTLEFWLAYSRVTPSFTHPLLPFTINTQ